MQVAQAGMGKAAARLGSAQGALAVMGPLLWAWVAYDLVGLALGTDYARLVRCVVAVAQVRALVVCCSPSAESSVHERSYFSL